MLVKVWVKPLVAVRRRRNTPYSSTLQGVNFKTVQWTVLEEATLWQKASLKMQRVFIYNKMIYRGKINVVHYKFTEQYDASKMV